MKTQYFKQASRLAVAAALIAAGSGMAFAGDCTPGQKTVAKVIDVQAPNGITQTVTVWVPQETTTAVASTTSTEKSFTVNAPAGNGPTQSVTVWATGTEKKFDVAPVK